MTQNESFLPETYMPAFYMRGAHGEPLPPNYSSNTGAVFQGMGGVTVDDGSFKNLISFGGVLAGAGIMYLGFGKLKSPSEKSSALPLMGLGALVAYFAGIRNL